MRSSLRQVLFRSATGLDLNFAGGVFSLNNTRTASPAAIPGWSFSRTDTNGTATALDLAGNVIQFSTGTPRITNRGILVEEARTNVIRNSVAAGAVAGTPGTLPTNWLELSLGAGISRQVVGVGTEDGLTYVDMRFFGTTSTSPAVQLNFEQPGIVAASAAQVWTTSCFTKLVAGSLADVSLVTLRLYPRSAVPAELPGVVSSDLKSEITAARARISAALTTPASTATVNTGIAFSVTGTKTLDFTIRLYSPQLELGAFATSPIITTGAAGTRGADRGRITQSPTASGTIIATVRIPTDKNNRRVVGTNGASAVTPLAYSTAGIETYNGSSTLGKTVSMTAGALVTVGVTWELGRRSVTGAGLAVATDANAIGSFTEMWFGQDDSLAAGNALNESIVRVQVLPYAVTDAQLQALTAP